jgi:hypothetical protein
MARLQLDRVFKISLQPNYPNWQGSLENLEAESKDKVTGVMQPQQKANSTRR